jgi:DNA-binding CsgD family transcriptional regulator
MTLYAFDRVRRLHLPLRSETPSLTPRERDVLTRTALGNSAKEIAKTLNISSRTVEWHILGACRKFGAVNRTQAVMIVLRDRMP